MQERKISWVSADLDDSLNLQDPYSDASLFLSRTIKEQIQSTPGSKHSSFPTQKKLLDKITAEFQKKFPRYRLGAEPLKKMWNKVSHFSELFEKQHDALTPDGKLNLHFLVRENLKTVLVQRKNPSFYPFLLAQQLATKVGESMATFEGVRPAIQNLTQLIWGAQQHLLPPSLLFKTSSPTPHLDVKDRLLMKWMLDCLMETPDLSQHALHEALLRRVQQFQGLKELKQPISWSSLVAIEWAPSLLPECHFIQTAPSFAIQKLRSWIQGCLSNIDLKEADNRIQDIKAAYLIEKPLQSPLSLYDLEILSWHCLKEQNPPSSPCIKPILDLISKEAKSQLVDTPQEHWKTAIQKATLFTIQASDVCQRWSKTDFNHRILYWSMQGELILRLLHFPETPLLHLAKELSDQDKTFNDPLFTSFLREQFLTLYCSPMFTPTLIHQKADLIRRYCWYHFLSTPEESTFDRWLLLHDLPLHHLDLDTRIERLMAKAEKELPFFPIDRKSIQSLLPIKSKSLHFG